MVVGSGLGAGLVESAGCDCVLGSCAGGCGVRPTALGGGSEFAGGGGFAARMEEGRFHGAVGNGVGLSVARY